MRLLWWSGPVEGREWKLDNEVTLGRDPTCDVILGDPSASPLEARIALAEGDLILENLGNSADLLVNQRPVSPGATLLLAHGSHIAVAGSELVVDMDGSLEAVSRETAPSPPTDEPFHPDRLVVVGRIVEAILRLGDRTSFFEKIVDAVFDTLEVRRAQVMLTAEETGEAETVACRNEEDDAPEGPIVVSRTILRRAIQDGRAQLLTDAMNSEDLRNSESVIDHNLRSVLCVPISTGDRPRGLIYADNRLREASFTAVDLEYLTMIGQLVGVVLENLDWRERQQKRLEALRARLREGVEFIHSSAEMESVLERIRKIATSESTVLVTGESGTGKELVARTLHNLSLRQDKPFVPVNCAALPEGLLESELFGAERGAFTGADRRRIGRFEATHGGTLFLDEIGEMSPGMQRKLLRVLEGHPFQRLGGNRSIEVDVRVIAATNRDLGQAVAEGRFREDLLYRIQVLGVDIPPLRERRDDILPLARYFLEQAQVRPLRLHPEVRRSFLRYGWPGNVRELKNAIDRAAIMCRGSTIRLVDLPDDVSRQEDAAPRVRELQAVVIDHVIEVYEGLGGNVKAAASALGIARNTMYRYLREAGRR